MYSYYCALVGIACLIAYEVVGRYCPPIIGIALVTVEGVTYLGEVFAPVFRCKVADMLVTRDAVLW